MRSSSKWISLTVAAWFLGGLLVSPVSARDTFMDANEIQATDVDLKAGPNLPREKAADAGEVQATDVDLKAGPNLPREKAADAGEHQAADLTR